MKDLNKKNITNETRFAELIFYAAKANLLHKAVFSKPKDKSVKKMLLTPKLIGGNKYFQAEYLLADNKAVHKNIPVSATDEFAAIIDAFGQINLLTASGDLEYRCSKSGNSIIIGNEKIFEPKSLDKLSAVPSRLVFTENNRRKNHILDGSEPFLTHLGISDVNGRIHDKKQAKFRQINRFLEYVRDIEKHLPGKEINILDLCCGKSYLSFAVYHYFANIKKIKIAMTGTDLKSDVIEYCRDVADTIGFDGLSFISGDIKNFIPSVKPDLVISLHACDTATDIVLDAAVKFGAGVILSTPCCHHEMNSKIDCPSLEFITKHSMLRQKLCEAATDALRLMRLEACGYEVAALELIDPEDTPKNILLKAIKKKKFDENSDNARALRANYERTRDFLLKSL